MADVLLISGKMTDEYVKRAVIYMPLTPMVNIWRSCEFLQCKTCKSLLHNGRVYVIIKNIVFIPAGVAYIAIHMD